MCMAWGRNGQLASLVPALGLVFVTSTNTEDGSAPYREIDAGYFIRRYLLPAAGD